jgi:protein-tyrosine-phosphatase
VAAGSASTARAHVHHSVCAFEGENADERMVKAAKEKGITIDHVCRALTKEDLAKFDHFVAMDKNNLEEMRVRQPHQARRGQEVSLCELIHSDSALHVVSI